MDGPERDLGTHSSVMPQQAIPDTRRKQDEEGTWPS
ncbi:rCG45276, isoform CRA_a [Rattus norvegicus]|uniref:RCG45276, isoform CRA_a n=1 Tax=Rattus norvegicus TaxID=10116 RepID=A6K9E7_RAT|nr:rCG45276, isoform CRA_a [Rattus norvegicus]EDL87440.1 rCG45276, isoform CRA_a [Rattus norvegicus]